jgi:hypothetical protein
LAWLILAEVNFQVILRAERKAKGKQKESKRKAKGKQKEEKKETKFLLLRAVILADLL